MIAASTVLLHRIVTGPLDENCYVASCGADAVIVDPGDGLEEIADHVKENELVVHAVLATHGHHDHVGAVAEVTDRYGVPFGVHSADARTLARVNLFRHILHEQGSVAVPSADIDLAGADRLSFGALEATVVHTPGHSPGSVCFEIAGELFTGDTLLADHVGRTDYPGGDRQALDASLERLIARFPADTVLRPGHGDPALLADVSGRLAMLPELGR